MDALTPTSLAASQRALCASAVCAAAARGEGGQVVVEAEGLVRAELDSNGVVDCMEGGPRQSRAAKSDAQWSMIAQLMACNLPGLGCATSVVPIASS